MSTGLKKALVSSAKTCLLLLVATVGAFLMGRGSMGMGKESMIMLYLLAVLFASVWTQSYAYGVLCAFCGVFLFNYFFTEPLFSLKMNSATDVTLLAFFFMTAITAGSIMSRLQNQRSIARRNEETARLVFEVSAGFVHVAGRDNIIMRGVSYIKEHTGCDAVVTLCDGSVFAADGFCPTDTASAASYTIDGASQALGTLAIYGDVAHDADRRELIFKTVAAQTGIALDREYIYNEREEIRIAMERERTRSTLLRSVAHDLRTPLTALGGASSLLSDRFDSLSPAERKELAASISDEIVWLSNIVENILNMTRISEQRLVLYKEYEVVDDVVSGAVAHMKKVLADRDFTVKLPSSVIALKMDGKLISQVIINLLDNAVKHTMSGSKISLEVEARDGQAVFSVRDDGEGIDPKAKDALFSSFVRSDKSLVDGKRGMGLGLSICAAVVEAHGGRIWEEGKYGQGAVFVFTLPMDDAEGSTDA